MTEIDEEGFFDYIVKDGVEPDVTPYLKNTERNVDFGDGYVIVKLAKKTKKS